MASTATTAATASQLTSIFRFAATANATSRRRCCIHCLRPFSSWPAARQQSSKRPLMTESRPQTLLRPDDIPPPLLPPSSKNTIGLEKPASGSEQWSAWQASKESSATTKTTASSPTASATPAANPSASPKKRKPLRPLRAPLTLTPSAVAHLRTLQTSGGKLIRIGVKNRGCSGLSYDLSYVTQPGTFDETVVQDGVKVLIDSKALFSIIGSEMDWEEGKLSAKFVFRNPNVVEACGCGESFSVG